MLLVGSALRADVAAATRALLLAHVLATASRGGSNMQSHASRHALPRSHSVLQDLFGRKLCYVL